MGPTKTRIEEIAGELEIYEITIALLASNHTTVQQRKVALKVKEEFEKQAPSIIAELLTAYE